MTVYNKLYKYWLNRWDQRIYTQDDRESEELIRNKLDFIFYKCEKILTSISDKASKKAVNGLKIESKEYYEAFYRSIKETEEKEHYKDLKKCSLYATSVRHTLNDIFEIKNRRGSEIFKLRAENSKLRTENEQLKNSINGND